MASQAKIVPFEWGLNVTVFDIAFFSAFFSFCLSYPLLSFVIPLLPLLSHCRSTNPSVLLNITRQISKELAFQRPNGYQWPAILEPFVQDGQVRLYIFQVHFNLKLKVVAVCLDELLSNICLSCFSDKSLNYNLRACAGGGISGNLWRPTICSKGMT